MIRVSQYEVSAICHSTESEAKVYECLKSFVPSDLQLVAITQVLRGHYGNVIKVMKIALKGDKAAKSAQLLIASMNPHDLDYLLSTLENRTEGSRIFLKFSKFKAFYGQKELVDRGDAIKVILSFSGYFKGLPPKSILSKVGLIPN